MSEPILLSKPGEWPRRWRMPSGNLVITDPARGIGLLLEPARGRLWLVVSQFLRSDGCQRGALKLGKEFLVEYGLN